MGIKRIGEYLVEKKVLTPAQVDQILEYGGREGLRFGEAGIKLGLLSEETFIRVFGKNYRVDFFHLESRFFPTKTKDLLSIDLILRYGVLPLGFKSEAGFFKNNKKILNLGMLDPGREEAAAQVEKQIQSQEDLIRTRVFLILAEQFLDVIQNVYQVSPAEIAQLPSEKLDPTLAMFLHDGRKG